MSSYYGEEDYDYERRRRPSPHRLRSDYRRSAHLSPPDGGGLYRTRSQGHGPVPVVNVYTDVLQDANQSSRSPSLPYPPSPQMRGRRDRLGDEFAEEFADLALENRRLRSRSRGRSDAAMLAGGNDWYQWKLDEMERRASIERERERIEKEYELKKVREDAKRRAEEDAAKDEKKRIIAEFEQKQREEEEDRKAEEKRIRDKIEQEKRDAKEKEEREWKEFLRKQREKEEDEKEEKKKEKQKVDDEMRRRLSEHGYTYSQIEQILKEKDEKATGISTSLTPWQGSRAPVYAKVHRDYLSIDTLKYYDIPWEYDRVSDNLIVEPYV